MKESNYWQQFMSTGSIEAYLSYRMECGGIGEQPEKRTTDLGVNPYAGVCDRNRNDFEGGACR